MPSRLTPPLARRPRRAHLAESNTHVIVMCIACAGVLVFAACTDPPREATPDTAPAADSRQDVPADVPHDLDTVAHADVDIDGKSDSADGASADGADQAETTDALVIPEACSPQSAASLVACVDTDRYASDLLFTAAVRPPGSPHWQAVQDRCAEVFAAAGFTVERHGYGTGVNVVGTLLGTTAPDEHVLLSAHYDHIAGCSGADDNASGVAGVLEAARVLGTTRFERTLVVACWDEEEDGLVGSLAYAERAAAQQDNIVVSFVFEMIGYADDAPNSQEIPFGFDLLFADAVKQLKLNDYRGDFIAFVPDESARQVGRDLMRFAAAVQQPAINLELSHALIESGLVADLERSDHAAFWTHDYPAVMITDTANFRNANYHCTAGEDSVERLNHPFAGRTIRATVGAAATHLHVVAP